MLGDCANVSPAAENDASPERLKADGFAVAPIIEAIMDVQFEGGLSAEDVVAVADILGGPYVTRVETRQTGFLYDAEAESIDVQASRSIFRLEGKDATEVALIRSDGISVSQVTPYKSWDLLFERFGRDWAKAEEVLGDRKVARLAVRYINRIDVPVNDRGLVEHEEYLASHIRIPESIPAIEDFYLRFVLKFPEIEAFATVQSAVMPQAVEGKASFALDIDLAKTAGLAKSRTELLAQLSLFRAPKNKLYRQLLTEKALGEFR